MERALNAVSRERSIVPENVKLCSLAWPTQSDYAYFDLSGGSLSSRRLFLGSSVAALSTLWLPKAQAKSRLQLAQLQHAGAWDVRPTALPRLAQLLDDRTSIDPSTEISTLGLGSASLFRFPFVVLAGKGAIPGFSVSERSRLKLFLEGGGFLWVDNAEARPGGDFDASVRAELAAILPEAKLGKVDPKHTLFKSFYILDKPVGRVATTSYVEAIEREGRLSVVFTQNDLLGAYATNKSEAWEYNVTPGGEDQRDRAFRFGVNIVMYALCLSYKSDGVHVDYLLKRRDWRGDE
jgi:Domain of unknown function (DUF4159)